MGSVYKRGNTWWIKFYRSGKPYRESAGSTSKRKAVRLLKKREGAVAEGTFSGLRPEKTTFDELATDYLNDYKINGKKSLSDAKRNAQRLAAYFGGARAHAITTDTIRAYIAGRQSEESERTKRLLTAATINRELAGLRRMFSLGRQAGKVVRVPYVALLREDNVRKGFFHHRDYLRLKVALPGYLKPLLTLGYWTGMRVGEILALKWDQVDFGERIIRLDPGTTKNRRGRIVPMSEEVLENFSAQWQLRNREFPSCQFVFFNHATGRRIKSFRRAWQSACSNIGLSGRLFHDLRRTGVRNLVRAGVPENVAMAISGHRTRSVFDRYDIVDESDIQAAAAAVEEYLSEATDQLERKVREIR